MPDDTTPTLTVRVNADTSELREQLNEAAKLGTRFGNTLFHVTTPDADSFRRSETQIAALLARAVGHGQRNL